VYHTYSEQPGLGGAVTEISRETFPMDEAQLREKAAMLSGLRHVLGLGRS
jgi:hypothetical protein